MVANQRLLERARYPWMNLLSLDVDDDGEPVPIALQRFPDGVYGLSRADRAKPFNVCQHQAPFAIVGHERGWVRS